MSASDQIVFFDLRSREPNQAWSFNPWKTRFVLNYKGLDYRTEWMEYPEIKPKFEKHLPPNQQGTPYTIPTVLFPDGTYAMDSRIIATELEKRYPKPSIHLDSPVLAKLEELMPQLVVSMKGVYMILVPQRIINEASQPHWYKTREERFGMPLDQLAREHGGQKAWDTAKPFFQEITAMLKEDQSGPYFLGKEVSYADFMWASLLIFMQKLGKDVWDKFDETVGTDAKAHEDLLLALGEWTLRNDK